MDVQFADLIASDPETARIWAAGSRGVGRLARADRDAFDTLMLKLWKIVEGQYWAHRLGSVRNSTFKARASGAVAMYRLPGVQQYFSERRLMYSAEFIEFLQTGKLDSDIVHLDKRVPPGVAARDAPSAVAAVGTPGREV